MQKCTCTRPRDLLSVRRVAGIYDERRYSVNGGAGGGSERSSSLTPSDSAHGRGSGGGRAAAPPRRGAERERGATPAAAPSGDDGGVVDCLCGARTDDGQAMIECERCQARPGARARPLP